jgi:hypothetical protein
MDRVEKIQRAVQEFSPEELAAFRRWFAAFDAEAWDPQFAADVEAEELDALAERALHDHAAGKSTKL